MSTARQGPSASAGRLTDLSGAMSPEHENLAAQKYRHRHFAARQRISIFLLLSRRAEERDSNERRVEQLCTLFEKNGVAFDRALLPDEETHLSLSLERDAAREEAFASALLGTAGSSDSGGGVSRFTGEYGSCSIRSGGTVDALLSRPVDDPESFCKQFFKTFGYTFSHLSAHGWQRQRHGHAAKKVSLIFNARRSRFLTARSPAFPAPFCPRSTRAAAQTASTRSTRLCIFWTIAAFRASCVPRSERWTKGIFSRRRLPRRCGCKACGASPRMSAVMQPRPVRSYENEIFLGISNFLLRSIAFSVFFGILLMYYVNTMSRRFSPAVFTITKRSLTVSY